MYFFFLLFFFRVKGAGPMLSGAGSQALWRWTHGRAGGQPAAPGSWERASPGQGVMASHQEKGFMGHQKTPVLR